MNTLDTALLWHSLGIATIPICAQSKKPALDHWKEYQNRLPTKTELTTWFNSGRYNLAVITGWRGLVVLDFDSLELYYHWQEITPAPDTYQVVTARGRHLYYYCQEETQTTPGPGWDVKAGGGYVLAPPSIHPSGHIYTGWMWATPADIATITSIWNLIAKPPEPAPSQPTPLDPWELAMRPDNSPGITIEHVKSRHTIAGILGCQPAKRRIMLKCPLPGHSDHNASFAVYPDGRFKCYGCGRKGDVIDLVAMLHNLDLPGALRWLEAH